MAGAAGLSGVRAKRALTSSAVAALAVAAGLLLPAAASARQTGSIAGAVTAAASGEAVGRVLVCADRLQVTEFEELHESCALTAAAGRYAIPLLPPGRYTVAFWPAYEGLDYAPQYYRGRSGAAPADLVSVGTETVTGIDAQLSAGARIEGEVTDASTGLPLEGVSVCVAGGPAPELGGCATTAADGRYALKGLSAPRLYTVAFWDDLADGYIPQYYDGAVRPEEADPVATQAGVARTGVDAALRVGGVIAGTVTAAANGLGLEGISVCALSADGLEDLACASTRASGEYSIRGLASGSYKVGFYVYPPQFYGGGSSLAAASLVTVRAPLTTRGIDARLGAPPAFPTRASAPPIPVAPHRSAPGKCRKGLRGPSRSRPPPCRSCRRRSCGSRCCGSACHRSWCSRR